MAPWTPKIGISGIPLLHLTFILNHFLPSRYFHIERIEEQEAQIREMESTASIIPLKRFMCGSRMEGLSVPSYQQVDKETLNVMQSDLDCMLIDNEYVVFQEVPERCQFEVPDNKIALLMVESGCKAGYVRLRELPERKGCAQTDSWYKTSDIAANKRLDHTNKDAFYDHAERHGPSSKLIHDKTEAGVFTPQNADKHMPFWERIDASADAVYAVRCHQWPNQAADWQKRNRLSGWPSVDIIASLVNEGCHLVQVAHPSSSNTEEEWRLSFSATEKVLVRSLSAVQRKSYVLLKIAVASAVGSSEIISSYHLKTVLFWTCEEVPAVEFTENTVGDRYIDLLDKLLTFLAKKNLPNYFVCGNNMIGHHPCCVIEEVSSILQQLRDSPLDIFVQFDKINKFTFALVDRNIDDSMDVVFRDISRVTLGMLSQGLETVFVSTFLKLFIFNIEENLFINALDTLIHLMSFKNDMYGTEIDMEFFLEGWLKEPPVPCLRDYPFSIFLEFCSHARPTTSIIEDISTFAFWKHFYSSLSRYFLRRKCEIAAEISETDRSVLDVCIYHAFEQAVGHLEASARDILDSYSWLFFDQDKFENTYGPSLDHLYMLKEYIQTGKPVFAIYAYDIEQIAAYDRDDQYLIHDPLLKMEIEGAGYIRVPTTVYLHYLLTVRAVKLHGQRSDEALINLDQILEEHAGFQGDMNIAQTYRFLGYACMYVGIFSAAVTFFRISSDLWNKSPNAHLMECICLGVVLCEALTLSPGWLFSLRDWHRQSDIT